MRRNCTFKAYQFLGIISVFYFHEVLRQRNTFIYKKLLVRKGSLFCDRGRLNFQAFA